MRLRSSAEQQTAHPALRKLVGVVVILLAISLPALWAFASIDAPLHPIETRRVECALFPDAAGCDLNEVARTFYAVTVTDAGIAAWPKARARVVTGARLSGMLALFAISGLVYLVLAQVRGRATGVIGSLSLATLVPVAQHGFLLRPEQAATAFGLLGVALLVGLPAALQRRGSPGRVPLVAPVCLTVLVGAMFGLAMALHQQAWIYLAVPALALMVSVLALVFLLPRATRGRQVALWPFRAASRRYVPWMLVVLLCSVMSYLILMQVEGETEPSSLVPVAESRLLPRQWWWSAPLLLFAVLGGLRMGYGVSLRLQRLRRVRPETVLFLYVAAMLMQYFLSDDSRDQLPAAAAMACLLGDGVMTAVVVLTPRLLRR
ncbi:MAG: hypothetical protein VX951_11145 [Planctomycetota bacterium]|nr:hypothetical protein [Planctomycetota bacterium]